MEQRTGSAASQTQELVLVTIVFHCIAMDLLCGKAWGAGGETHGLI